MGNQRRWQDAYSDDTTDLEIDSRGRRYGLDPQLAQSNGTFFIDSHNGDCTTYTYSHHSRFAPQLSPNFTKTWKPKVINSEGLPNVNWNPVGPPGLITNGLELEIFH